jgi:hypothetical protein
MLRVVYIVRHLASIVASRRPMSASFRGQHRTTSTSAAAPAAVAEAAAAVSAADKNAARRSSIARRSINATPPAACMAQRRQSTASSASGVALHRHIRPPPSAARYNAPDGQARRRHIARSVGDVCGPIPDERKSIKFNRRATRATSFHGDDGSAPSVLAGRLRPLRALVRLVPAIRRSPVDATAGPPLSPDVTHALLLFSAGPTLAYFLRACQAVPVVAVRLTTLS